MKGGRRPVAAAALALAAVLGPGATAAQEEGAEADTAVARDTLEGPAADTARGPDPEAVRQGLAGGAFPDRDSIFAQLAGAPGYRAVEYRGRQVELEVPERTVRLRDSAQSNYGDAALRADSITYRARLQFISARGGITLVSPDRQQMATDSVLYYDVSRQKGTVLRARTQFAARGADWYVEGDAVPVGRETLYVNRGSFTSCEEPEPHYYFRAGQIKMVSGDVIVAWPVTLYISEVPVFWLPFFAQDIRPHRRSGIVPPEFGFNDVVRTSQGYQRQISGFGYYWAISRFMDAKMTADWFSGNYTSLNGTFRYRFLKDFIEGQVGVRHQWGEGGRNLAINARHDQQLGPDTRFDADIQYVQSERLVRRRSFETEELTQDINSDVGLEHEFSFANLSLSASRRQSLGVDGGVDQTLPAVNLSFSPVTLFQAPRSRAGFFNNLTWNGSVNFTRQSRTRSRADDRLSTDANVNQSLRLGRLSLTTSGSFRQEETDPLRAVVDTTGAEPDTTFVELASTLQSTARWRAGADYQVDLMGSTTLSPGVEVSGAWFRSDFPADTVLGEDVPDTGGDFVAAPTRFSATASLSTDLYGLLPGFGPFSTVRHKISPRFSWRYSPEVTLSDTSLADVPGFPAGGGQAQHTLSVNLNQTFEAKMPVREEEEAPQEEDGEGDGAAGEAAEEGAPGAEGGERGDATGEAPDGDGREAGAGVQAPTRRERKVTLLSIRSSSLEFDFNRPGPTLVTDRFTNNLSSDLLRGFSISLAHDLFEGSGADRRFRPFLSRVNVSFSLSSGMELGELVGLGPDGGRPAATRTGGEDEAGRWNLALDYTLDRRREGEVSGIGLGGGESQTLGGSLQLQPTPNWEMRWTTHYDFTEGRFGSHSVTLTRDLHRWLARFDFRKAVNGNLIFRFMVQLRDAPELKVAYDQRTGTSLVQ